MDFLLVTFAAGAVSVLTFFCGFGLGTLLMPVFALVAPVELAVAATAIVHLANNVFKLMLVGRRSDRAVVLAFGLPAVIAALIGAWLLTVLAHSERPMLEYPVLGRTAAVTPLKLVMALVIIAFAAIELWPRFEKLEFDQRWIPLGGAVSGFFGGLSGHQGALRSAFLLRAGLSKESFIASGVVIACLVDVARLGVYGVDRFAFTRAGGSTPVEPRLMWLIAAASLAAFAGSVAGMILIRKVTLKGLRVSVALALMVLGLTLGAGIV